MRTLRKRAALLLALTLTAVSLVMPLPALADVEQTPGEVVTAGEQEITAGQKDTVQGNKEKRETVSKASPGDAESEKESSQKPSVEKASPSEPKEKDSAQKPALMSLLDVTRHNAVLQLNKWSDEELKAVPLREILDNLKDHIGGNKVTVTIGEGKKILVNLYSNSNDEGDETEEEYHLSDDYVPMELDDTLDLSVVNRNRRSYFTLEILISSGEQLDYSAERYIIRVYLQDEFYVSYDYNLYGAQGGTISATAVTEVSSGILGDSELPVTAVSYYIPQESYGADKEYKLGISYYLSEAGGLSVEAYRMSDFMQYYDRSVSELESSKAVDMISSGSGNKTVQGHFAPVNAEDPLAADNFFCIVYRDSATGKVAGYEGLIFTVYPGTEAGSMPKGSIYVYENGQMVNIVESSHSYADETSVSRYANLGQEQNVLTMRYFTSTESTRYSLKTGYAGDGEYYYMLDQQEASRIRKVVEGYCRTLEAAESAADITGQVLPADRNQASSVYKTAFRNSYSKQFTVIYSDGTLQPYYIYLSGDGNVVPYSDKPVLGEDPWFNITGVEGANAYAVQNTDDVTYDTLYGYGYQTVIVDENTDLSKVKLNFKKATNVTIQRGSTDLVPGETEVDFSSEEPLLFTAHFKDEGGKTRNYYVRVVKKTSGPKLYVNYPDQHPDDDQGNTREVFLTEYFENRHDILIANVGDADLADLKVELRDAQNVILDDYWTVGSLNTLKHESYMSSSYDNRNNDNLAKIRLLPDPNSTNGGKISGTLVISAGGETVEIELTGYASNPQIITKDEELDDAVKYVPYSYIIATDNMYDFNDVTFSYTGRLPEGVTLSPRSGELYGVPKEVGDFTFTVKAEFSHYAFVPSRKEFTLTVLDNTNANVYNSSDSGEGYALLDTVGTDQGGYDFLLPEISDQVFRSEGEYDQFVDFYLNGEKLVENTDYTKEPGSTKITIRSQTFQNKAKRDGTQNTIAAEFRRGTSESNGSQNQGLGAENVKDMKRTAQNFRTTASASSSGSSSGDSVTSVSASGSGTVIPDDSWTNDGTGWRHPMPDGSWAVNTWLQLAYGGVKDWYYFNEQGYMATGWLNLDGVLYYLNPVADGFQGRMLTGWQQIDGRWYYFSEAEDGTKGALFAAGWHQLFYNNILDWYYFNQDHYMMTGWITVDGHRYYLNPLADGFQGRMLTGWQRIDGKWYYFNEVSDGTKGALLTSTHVGQYYVNQDGVWVP